MPRKGQKLSEEARRKLSEKAKSPERIAISKINIAKAPSRKGMKASEEALRKRSESLKLYAQSNPEIVHNRAITNLKKSTSRKGCRYTELSKIAPDTFDKCRGSYAVTIVHKIKSSAKKRDKEWNLTDIEVYNLIISPCHYCGLEANWPDKRNGIDRVDNALGYITTNVVSCCPQCNFTKGKMPVLKFKEYIERTYKHLNRTINS